MKKRLFTSTLLLIAITLLISSQMSVELSAPWTVQKKPVDRASSLSIQSTPNPSEPNHTVTISGRLVSGSQVLAYRNVRIDSSVDTRMWGVVAWTETKKDGDFALSWTPPQSTSIYIRAYFPGDKQYSSSFSDIILQEVVSATEIFVTINSTKTIGANNLSLGFMLDHEWKGYVQNSVRRELARDARFSLIRVFDYKGSSPRPCVYWNESARTGTFNWTDVDLLVQRIFEIGAEPMLCVGGYKSDGPRIPLGMEVNPVTNLPYPESFAAYASEWVKHFRALGLPVRFYEIINEPWVYFGWEPVDFAKLKNYMQLFNAAAASMRQENFELLISHDFIIRKPVLDYWLANGGADVDCLNFHKYDSYAVDQKTDAEMLRDAEQAYFGTWPMGYSIDEARQVWLDARGKLLPVINSESNFDSAFKNGTDPRIQQMAGAVWTALVLRMGVLKGLSHNVYYSLSSSASYGKTTATGGAGFGMINSDNNLPWYPYHVQHILGNNLHVGDVLVDAKSPSEDIRTLSWIHDGTLNVFLICKVDEPRNLYLQGVRGEAKFIKIDNTISWTTPSVQSGVIDVAEPLLLKGYTVVLLLVNSPAQAQSGTFRTGTTGTTISAHEDVYRYAVEDTSMLSLRNVYAGKRYTFATQG